ncbi:siderophore synthetase component [Haloactinospora alba]|uniref:Siderophore synthetase component n=1 Tax=Haloactinospora alba TaxID=405555 RepID=A0A543NL09_9ACTN|nr:IucA/IucC family protein [Haloactinospora alba]TQN32499.1 siderophore synthetase component [Haloactinospora alba]
MTVNTGGPGDSGSGGAATAAHPPAGRDFDRVADTATTNGLLRCWLRETGAPVPERGTLTLDLPASGTRLETEVLHHSPAGFHRFGPARLAPGTPVSAVTVAALLAEEAAAGRDSTPETVSDLVARVADSQRRTAHHLTRRSAETDEPDDRPPFLAAEQALVLGHPLHPAPKSRIGVTDTETEHFSPELRGSFPVHWFAADPSVVSSSGDAHELLAPIAPETPPGTVPIPAHPWQAREIRTRPGVRERLAEGTLRDVGPGGPEWYPTASLRTLYAPGVPVMLKLSLGLPITNSKRENLRAELRRGAEIDRLLDAGLASELAAAYPTFGIVRDPAWITVDPDPAAGTGRPESGLETVLRANPFPAGQRSVCVAGLLAERPDTGTAGLSRVVAELEERTGRDRQDIAEEWCARYADTVLAPVLWLYGTYGLGLEAHQQNTLVTLDDAGWPSGGWYRDNQGYYISERRSGELDRILPGVGDDGANRCDDAVIDERLGYYIGVNNVLGLVGAFGALGIADERPLLEVFRERLRRFDTLPLARTLAESETLRCKANLLTRIDGLDELVGPLETQSVYRTIANPFTAEVRSRAGA